MLSRTIKITEQNILDHKKNYLYFRLAIHVCYTSFMLRKTFFYQIYYRYFSIVIYNRCCFLLLIDFFSFFFMQIYILYGTNSHSTHLSTAIRSLIIHDAQLMDI